MKINDKRKPLKRRQVSILAGNRLFLSLLWINAALCLVALAVMIWASTHSEPVPKAMERLVSACEHVFTLTAGAFMGLLGGRVALPDDRPRAE